MKVRLWICVYLVISTLLLTVSKSFAQEDIFSSEVLVTGQSKEEFLEASTVGLESILEQIADNKLVLNRPEVEKALPQADSLVEQFSYRIITDDDPLLEMNLTPMVEAAQSATYVFQVRYSPEAVEELLGEQISARSQMQTDTRPSIVWMIFEEDGSSQIIGEDLKPLIADKIVNAADDSGINLVFPLLDLQDLQSVSIADIRGGFNEQIKQASDRYDVSSIITGVIKRINADIWVADWRNLSPEGYTEFKTTADNIDTVIQGGINWFAGLSRSTQPDTQLNALSSFTKIWVGYVDSTAQYAHIVRFLEAFPEIVSVRAEYLSVAGMMFSISPRIPPRQLTHRLSGIPWLQQIPRPDNTSQTIRIPDSAEIFFEYAG